MYLKLILSFPDTFYIIQKHNVLVATVKMKYRETNDIFIVVIFATLLIAKPSGDNIGVDQTDNIDFHR